MCTKLKCVTFFFGGGGGTTETVTLGNENRKRRNRKESRQREKVDMLNMGRQLDGTQRTEQPKRRRALKSQNTFCDETV